MKNNKVDLKKIFSRRRPETHKGDYGKVFIFAGSSGMMGAGVLCCRGALRGGAGLVYWAAPGIDRDILNLATPEVIVAEGDGLAYALSAQAVVVGPGLGECRSQGRKLLEKLSKDRYPFPVVLDADGINAFAGEMRALRALKLKLILTPHPGEMGRLAGRTAVEVQAVREKYAREIAGELGCVVALKGHRTVVSDGQRSYINNTGNPGMASAGVGDVLTGLIASLAVRGIDPFQAAVAGVYLHGLAGDLAAKDKGEYGLSASDLVEKIPYAISKNN